MEVCRRSSGLLLLLGLSLLASTLQGVQGEVESEQGPSESECRPYIEKALKELETGEPKGSSEVGESGEDLPTVEITTDDPERQVESDEDNDTTDEDGNDTENAENPPDDNTSDQENSPGSAEAADNDQEPENKEGDSDEQQDQPSAEDDKQSEEATDNQPSNEESKEETEGDKESVEQDDDPDTKENDSAEKAESKENEQEGKEEADTNEDTNEEDGESEETKNQEEPESKEDDADTKEDDSVEEQAAQATEDDSKEGDQPDSKADADDSKADDDDSKADDDNDSKTDSDKDDDNDSKSDDNDSKADDNDSRADDNESKADDNDSKADDNDSKADDNDSKAEEDENQTGEVDNDSKADDGDKADDDSKEEGKENEAKSDEAQSVEDDVKSAEGDEGEDKEAAEASKEGEDSNEGKDGDTEEEGDDTSREKRSVEDVPEEELGVDTEVPTDLRPRDHVEKLLKLDDDSAETEKIINKVAEVTLKELKKLYENAIKPLEVLYKYRDLSNRHFGDAEIFSKPLILFMGPWSGGKSSIINYLVNNEYNETSLRTGAEPSPAYFNILMYGEEPEIIDGTELAADYTFSGLQKFGQGLEERLRGVKLPNKLLEKVNIVEIPGILEVRKQVSRVFPFNDACQWFIDRADIIFLVYDPSKLDVGPETEAILDQLKGREPQTRIVLNKADQVKPEELMRVQGALIWNISPLMSSPQPPTMYTTSLWSRPYEPWAPVRLLQAQERAFLRDLRGAIDKRIENKIASARRFAVRVRNHAKMVDCYLTTYYNHKSVFGNRKQVADEIIEHPQDYHIYEGLSTLTNISRYDLPDPEVYKDFFKLNPLYDFQQLSATCTYFRGCPINRLDVAIAYDLPELVGTHKKLVENALAEAESQSTAAPGS